MRIDHINIAAPAELLEQVKDFYCAVFDFTEGFRPDFSQSKGYWLYAEDRPLIHLSVKDVYYGDDIRSHIDHIAFRMTGLRSVADRLEAIGIDFRADYVPEISMTQLFFRDPAGNGLEANFVNEVL
jgi:catechol 2,3-dioxygenase-like lactoylglutathione lyase family enzyme